MQQTTERRPWQQYVPETKHWHSLEEQVKNKLSLQSRLAAFTDHKQHTLMGVNMGAISVPEIGSKLEHDAR